MLIFMGNGKVYEETFGIFDLLEIGVWDFTWNLHGIYGHFYFFFEKMMLMSFYLNQKLHKAL